MSAAQTLKGVKIRTFNIFMIAVSCVVFLCLIYDTVIMPAHYHHLIAHTDEYILCENDANSLSAASDYLTEQVRLYVENMDIRYMDNYFEEIHVAQRREKALAELSSHDTTDAVRHALESALECSNDLMEREIYAMELVSTANGYAESSLPEEVRRIQLKAADAALSPDEMIEKARTMVFDSGYQDAKALIRSHLDYFLDGIISSMAQRQADSAQAMGAAISLQRLLIILLFVINVITFVVITVLIVRPLTIHIRHIKENNLLEITGSYEFKYLAITYNDIYELNAANQAMLTQKAEHDPLTGLMNRRAYDDLTPILKKAAMPLALVLIDVDQFKLVNDLHGHEAGDLILKKISALLLQAFRSTDYVIRFGGDEFAVVMTDIAFEGRHVLEEKIAMLNRILKEPDDQLPPVSLSVGAAFSGHGFRDDLFALADRALYEVKESGRCGCRICLAEDSKAEVSAGA